MRTRTYNTHNGHNGHNALVTTHPQPVLRAPAHAATRHAKSLSQTLRAHRRVPSCAHRNTPVAAELGRFGPYQTGTHRTASPLRGVPRPSLSLPSSLHARDGPHTSPAPCHTRLSRTADPHHYPSRPSHTAYICSGPYPTNTARASHVHYVSLDSHRTCRLHNARTLHGSPWPCAASAWPRQSAAAPGYSAP